MYAYIYWKFRKVAGFEMEWEQVIHLKKKLGFIERTNHRAKLKEVAKHSNEKETFVALSLFPEGAHYDNNIKINYHCV